jgi:hypothetical protein
VLSQNFTYKSILISSDSITDIIVADSTREYLVFSKYVGIEESDTGQYRQKFQQGLITPGHEKIFFETTEEYIGSIDNYVYTVNYNETYSRKVRCYYLNGRELLFINSFEVEQAIGYFQINEINKVIVYSNSSEGFGTNIIILNKDLNKILEYKPFKGLYTSHSFNGMILHKLIFSFQSEENPYEFKIFSYDLMNNKVSADTQFINKKEYLDEIISFEEGIIVFGCYDVKGYNLIRLNAISKQILNQTSFDFGTKILDIRDDQVIFHSNTDLFSVNSKSFKENWKFKFNVHPDENVAISSVKTLFEKDTLSSSKNYLILLNRYNSLSKDLIGNKLIILNNAGELVDSVILPEEVQFDIFGPLIFHSDIIKIYTGNKEIELIMK